MYQCEECGIVIADMSLVPDIDKETIEKSLQVACNALEQLIADHRELKIQIQAAIMSGETETDKDGFISAYHFKTGAIHRLLKMARER